MKQDRKTATLKTSDEIEKALKKAGVGTFCQDHFMHACNRADSEGKAVEIPAQSKRGPHVAKCLVKHGGPKKVGKLLNREIEFKGGSHVFHPQQAILAQAKEPALS